MFSHLKLPRRTFLRGVGASMASPYLDMHARHATGSFRLGAAGAPGNLVQPNGVFPELGT